MVQGAEYNTTGRITSYNRGTVSQSFQTGHTYRGNTAPVVLGCDDDIAYLEYPSKSSPFKNKYSMPTKDQAKEFTQGGYIYAVKNTGDAYLLFIAKQITIVIQIKVSVVISLCL